MLNIANILAARLPVPAAEMTSDGFAALIDAVQRFDPSRGASFQTFAGYRVRGAILDAVRRRDRDVGRQARQRQRVQDDIAATFAAEHGRQPSEAELKPLLPPMAPQMRNEWRRHVQRATPASLDVPITMHDGRVTTAAASVVATGASPIDRIDDRDELNAMIADLPDTIRRTLLTLLNDPDVTTSAEVAERRGMSPSGIQRHLAIAREHFKAFRRGERVAPAAIVEHKPPQVVRRRPHPLLLLIVRRPRRQERTHIDPALFPLLTRRQREIAGLRHAGLSHTAIGQRLGITRFTSSVTLKDARKRLRRVAAGAGNA